MAMSAETEPAEEKCSGARLKLPEEVVTALPLAENASGARVKLPVEVVLIVQVMITWPQAPGPPPKPQVPESAPPPPPAGNTVPRFLR